MVLDEDMGECHDLIIILKTYNINMFYESPRNLSFKKPPKMLRGGGIFILLSPPLQRLNVKYLLTTYSTELIYYVFFFIKTQNITAYMLILLIINNYSHLSTFLGYPYQTKEQWQTASCNVL